MPDEPLPLFQVLIEEYNHQQEIPYPGLEEGLKRYRAVKEKDEDGRRRINSEEVKKFYRWLHTDLAAAKRSALCFSGGGIRSATFGLGVLQGLARRGLLRRFDFMSTVSGGGYLGSWLSAWIHRKGLDKVEERLKNESPSSPLSPEPDPIVHLRTYSNYMSPKIGLLSADTWTLVAIFIRNLILNWLVLLPPILLVLMVPRICVLVIRAGSRPWLRSRLSWLLPGSGDFAFWLALVLGMIAVAYVYLNRPSLADAELRDAADPGSTFKKDWKTQAWFLSLCLAPLLGAAVAITTYYAWFGMELGSVTFWGVGGSAPVYAFIRFGILFSLGGLFLALPWLRGKFLGRLPGEILVQTLTGATGGALTWLIADKLFPNPAADIQSTVYYVCFAAPAFLGLFLLAATVFTGAASRFTEDADREWLARAGAWILIAGSAWVVISAIVIFGPALVMYGFKTVMSLGTLSGFVTLVLGHSSKTEAKSKESINTTDILMTLAAPVFAIFILICLSLGTSWLIVELSGNTFETSEVTRYEGLLHILEESSVRVLSVISILCVAIGVIASGVVNINKFSLHSAYRDRLIRAYLGASRVENERKPNPFTGLDENDNLQMQQLRTQLFHEDNVKFDKLIEILKAAPDAVSHDILRRFSQHARNLIGDYSGVLSDELKYALLDDLNRLVQGPSIYDKDRFNGIELKAHAKHLLDQKPLVETVRLNRLLLESAYLDIFLPAPKCRPLHVVNITLNLVGGKNLAWQNRQAESFTVSTLHSGSYCVGYRNSNVYGRNYLNQAISLGTAAAISGAAVSPNMGYYSSTFVTFLLALFNLRLGWWLGNPGGAGGRNWGLSTYDKAGPNFAIRPLIDETLGLTDDKHPYVYLSDGGHFENLGLYEMVLRRCKLIVVSDGSADPDFGFEGLGNAISKIRVDLGVPLEIDNIYMLPRDKDEDQRRFGELSKNFRNQYCAVGTIGYSRIDRVNSVDDGKTYDGVFVYIKPFLSGQEPVDVYNYAKTHSSFPHESTADQMYSESQFESYRALGSYLVDKIAENVSTVSLEAFVNSIEQKVRKAAQG